MREFLKTLFLISLSAVILYPLLVISSSFPVIDELSKNFPDLKKNGNGYNWKRLQEVDSVRNVDVLILGSSLAYRGIDNRNFEKIGLRAFNLGSSSQTPIQTNYLLEKYLDQLNPKMIIWDVNPSTFSNSGVESFLDFLSTCLDCQDLYQMMFEINDLLAYNGYLKRTFVGVEENSEYSVQSKDMYISGGFVESEDLGNIGSSFQSESKEIEFIKYQKTFFEKSLIKLQEKEIDVILVYSPVSEGFYRSITNIKEINDYFLKCKEEYNVVDYLDFNRLISIPNSCFSDAIHLAECGVEKYNDLLIKLVGIEA